MTDKKDNEKILNELLEGVEALKRNEYKTLSLKLTGDITLADIDKRAEELEMNRSQFVNMALEMVINYDKDFWRRIDTYSKGLNAPPWLIIQNMLIKRFAEEAAHIEVWGPEQKLLDEFMSTKNGDQVRNITGEELFNILKQNFIKDQEQRRINYLREKERDNVLLTEEEKIFLIKHRTGRAWYESEEGKKALEEQMIDTLEGQKLLEQAQAEGYIKPPFSIGDIQLRTLVKAIKNGLPKEIALEELKNIINDNKIDEQNVK